MTRIGILLAVLATALALAANAMAAAPKLAGTVGPGFTITLKKGGKKVNRLKAGKYTLVVADKSAIHNFHLKGPGLNKTTGISFKGTKTFTIRLKKGTYKFVCDPHASTMHGSFKVA